MSYKDHRRHSGKFLQCLCVTDSIAIGVSTLDELETYGLKRPSFLEDARKKDLGSDSALKAAHDVREVVQRRFDKARRKRAVEYGIYVNGLFNGSVRGGVPPITLFCPTEGTQTERGLLLPHMSPLVTLDGETQTEARFDLREQMPDTGDVPIMFVLYHGIDAQHAGAIMHDFNVFAHPVAEAAVSALNINGALTTAVISVLQELNIHTSAIARLKTKPGKGQLTTYDRLIAGAAGVVLGSPAATSIKSSVRRLNTQPNGVNREDIRAFLIHAVRLTQENSDVGRSNVKIWALAGGIYHEQAKLLSAPQWLSMAASYNATKPPAGSRPAVVKRDAAYRAVGLSVQA